MVAEYADVLQIGARNMQNFSLLKQLGALKKPILLKRGPSATIKEWLMAAEYILSGGNYQVALCERGIRTFETMTRNTLDLNAVPVLKALTHLPVIVDPSHGIGIRAHVGAMARGAVACGADGIIVEVHPQPEKALSDGHQSLTPVQFGELVRQVAVIAGAVGRTV
jgi:3-deoxy-7-phosphoheptulonate synthase